MAEDKPTVSGQPVPTTGSMGEKLSPNPADA